MTEKEFPCFKRWFQWVVILKLYMNIVKINDLHGVRTHALYIHMRARTRAIAHERERAGSAGKQFVPTCVYCPVGRGAQLLDIVSIYILPNKGKSMSEVLHVLGGQP